MRSLVVIAAIVLIISVLALTSVLESLIFFILTGYIPIINLSLPPIFMLLFWILVVPCSVLFYQSINLFFWKFIEIIGNLHQRRLNLRARLPVRKFTLPSSLESLVIIYLLEMLVDPPLDPAADPKLSLHRRSLAAAS